MAKKFLTPINFVNLESDPAAGNAGDIYYNTSSNKFKYHNGSIWIDFAAGSGIVVDETAPSTPSEGDAWFKESTNSFYIYDGTYWIEVATTISLYLVDDPNPTLSANMSASGHAIENIGWLGFDTSISASAISTTVPGTLFWNNEEGTLDLVMEDEVLQSIGMELYMPPTNNNSGVVIPRGSVVMATGVQGDRITIAKAITNGTIEPEYIIGIADENIGIGSEKGLITINGTITGLNTSAWPVGTVLYPNPNVAGGLTASAPYAPAIKTPIAIVLRQHANTGRIYVRMTNGSKLGKTDSNVEFNNLQDGDVLTYVSASSLWTNLPSSGGAALSSGSAFPISPEENSLFFNASNLTFFAYAGNGWKEVGSTPPLDGGSPEDTEYGTEINGGEPSTAMIGGISGGEVIQNYYLLA